MIYSLDGFLVDLLKFEGFYMAAIKCSSGVCFEVKVSENTASSIKNKQNVNLYTHLILRENLMELYGFYSLKEKECFKLLISVSGVGPSFAISVLSMLTPLEFFSCVTFEDHKKLCECKGIGKKTAERIILELKDRVKNISFEGEELKFNKKDDIHNDFVKEAVEALVVLGYSKNEAYYAVKDQEQKESVEDLIKGALLNLSKK